MLDGLFDSGASGMHMKRQALRNVRYTSTKVNDTRTMIKEKVGFKVHFPDFYKSRIEMVKSALIKKQ